MAAYRTTIATCVREHITRHKAIHATFAERDRSPEHYERWKDACAAFRTSESQMFDLLYRCLNEGLEHDPDLRQFAFEYMDQDPYYFRSGYLLGELLQKVKRLELTEAEKVSIRRLVLKRIDTRALREFRRICRLIWMVQDAGFHAQVLKRAEGNDPDRARRARFALAYFDGETDRTP